jgi:hypothetical protein
MEPANPLPVTPADAEDVPAPARPAIGRAEQAALPLDLSACSPAAEVERPLPPAAPVGPSAAPIGPSAAPSEPPTDTAHDQPIGFALTARARRAVAPGTLPELSLVGVGSTDVAPRRNGELEEPGDTRPARARALRRAGVPLSAIGRQLDADPLAITAWVGEVAPSTRPRRPHGTRTSAPVGAEPDERPAATAPTADEELEVAAQLAQAAAAELARQRLCDDPGFGIAVGLLAATATTDRHAVTITATDARQVARTVGALTAEDPAVPVLVRVIVRVGPQLAGDLVRHRVAAELGVDPVQVSWTRWRSAPRPDAVQLLVRIAEPSLAATVAGWIDAALEPAPQPLDIAF